MMEMSSSFFCLTNILLDVVMTLILSGASFVLGPSSSAFSASSAIMPLVLIDVLSAPGSVFGVSGVPSAVSLPGSSEL